MLTLLITNIQKQIFLVAYATLLKKVQQYDLFNKILSINSKLQLKQNQCRFGYLNIMAQRRCNIINSKLNS